MIKSKLTLLLVWPIVLLVGLFLYFSYVRQQINKQLTAAVGVVWGTVANQFNVTVIQQADEYSDQAIKQGILDNMTLLINRCGP